MKVNKIECFLLIPPEVKSKFKKCLLAARGKFKNNRFAIVNNRGYRQQGDDSLSIYTKNDPVMYYFDNILKTMDDVNNLIDSAFSKEIEAGNHHVKFYADFGVIIEEYVDNPKTTLKEDEYKYTYEPPMDRNTQTVNPMIVKDSDGGASLDKYKLLVKDHILDYQEKALQSTKHKKITLYSMTIVAYRLPKPGGAAAKWVKIHLKQGITLSFDISGNLCLFVALSYLTMPDTVDKKIYIRRTK
jgi:hypothetical protein